jgi:hypothetical protein
VVSTTAPGTGSPFRRRTLIILISVGLVSLGVALFLAAFADDFTDKQTAGTNGYSKSAIGYEGLIELLRASDIPVMDSQHDSPDRAREGLLVVFAPELDSEREELKTLIGHASRVLLVLPRWWGEPDDANPGWIASRYELDRDDVEAVYDQLGDTGTIDRVDASGGSLVGENPLPSIDGAIQVVDDAALTREIRIGDATLLGKVERDGSELWILADPSPVDNAGLRRPGNPEFAVALIDRLRHGGPVVFDETVHGFEDTPSLWKALFRFPLVLVSLHVLIGCVLILWAAVGRFGPPRAAGAAVPSGKDFLIRNTAELLHVAGHDADALRRYLATTIHQTRVALHAPSDLDPAGLRRWLERIRVDRGGTISIVELEGDVFAVAHAKKSGATARRIVELSARVHRWRAEMTHGPQRNS